MINFDFVKQEKEVPYEDFIEILKVCKCQWASTSHSQYLPNKISYAAILQWQYDECQDCIYAITADNKRVECSPNMPAFYIYNISLENY